MAVTGKQKINSKCIKFTSWNSHSGTPTTGKNIEHYKKGDIVNVTGTTRDRYGTVYAVIGSGKNKTYVNSSYITNIKKASNAAIDSAIVAPNASNKGITKTDGTYYTKNNRYISGKGVIDNDPIYANNNTDYQNLLYKYIRAFGSPPRYTQQVDPYYTNVKATSTGRTMLQTWFTDPSILSIAPGTVDYLPGFSSNKKDEFFLRMKSVMADAPNFDKDSGSGKLDGKLYSFKSAYSDYINHVNLLARACSVYLGIGEVNNIIYGSNVSLDSFDYGFYTSPSSTDSKKASSIWSRTLKTASASINSAVTDSSYVHFFVNHSGSSVSESISTSSGESWLEQQLGDDNGISQTSRNLEFLFGGAIGKKAQSDINDLLSSIGDNNSLLRGMTTITTNYLKGGRLVFPQMITGMDYQKSISVDLKFSSIYGDKRSIFKYTILPALHLLVMATPKQLSANMYTYPYLVRCFQRGNLNCDLAFISSLDLTRGGESDTSWTVDGLPTEINARLTITPLYSNMMVTSSLHPSHYFQNDSLQEYLATLCGFDMKNNTLQTKVTLAKKLIERRIKDIPANTARAITDWGLVNELRNFTNIVGA